MRLFRNCGARVEGNDDRGGGESKGVKREEKIDGGVEGIGVQYTKILQCGGFI